MPKMAQLADGVYKIKNVMSETVLDFSVDNNFNVIGS